MGCAGGNPKKTGLKGERACTGAGNLVCSKPGTGSGRGMAAQHRKERTAMKQCRITVLRKLYQEDLVKERSDFGPEHGPCPMFTEGQVFLCGMEMPQGFCGWAWDDIHKLVFAALGGADFNELVPGSTKDGRGCIACCTDGYRPVVFWIEAVEAE